MAESKASFGYMTTNVACSSDDLYPAAVSVTRQLEWETSMTATSSARLGEGLTIWRESGLASFEFTKPDQIHYSINEINVADDYGAEWRRRTEH